MNPVPKNPVVVQNQGVIHIVNPVPKNPVPKHQPVNPVPKHQPQPYAKQHTAPTGPTIAIVEEDSVY